MIPDKEYEINLAICEKIMGFERVSSEAGDYLEHLDGSWFRIETDNYLSLAHKFCTDMTSAWKVMEILSDEDGCGKFELDKHWDCELDKYTWGCSFIHNEPFTDWVWADTAPMAICLAAIKYRESK